MKTAKRYSGVVVPMMTAFTPHLEIDIAALHRLTSHIIEFGAHPFVLGTTGEAVSIARQQRLVVVKETIAATSKKAALYAGISGNCLNDAIEEGNAYAALGVDAVVSTMPSYYPVDEEQMLRYFTQLANALHCPLIIYNIPSTTHLSIPISVAEQLSAHSNIVGFKDSEKGVERISAATTLWKDRPDFSYLLGWALMSKMALELGADGIIPSSGNLVPSVYQGIYTAVLAGNKTQTDLAQLKGEQVSAMYQKDRILSHSLSAFKVMLDVYGLCGPDVLPPLYRMKNEEAFREAVIEKFGTIHQINSLANVE